MQRLKATAAMETGQFQRCLSCDLGVGCHVLHFYKRLILVLVFANHKKSKEGFHFYEKKVENT